MRKHREREAWAAPCPGGVTANNGHQFVAIQSDDGDANGSAFDIDVHESMDEVVRLEQESLY